MANGGTIFLDDVDDVPLAMQVKLLRVIQNRTVERLGGGQAIPVDVRIITGSKKDLKQMVADGRFREDLYYRLNVIPVSLPPLRERREDIPSLVDHFVKRYAHIRGVDPMPLSPSVMDAFLRYPWPGNVRELENACERMVQTCSCHHIRTGCVPSSVLFHAKSATPESAPPPTGDVAAVSLDERLQDVERSLITWALRSSGGNKSRAAELLKVKRSTLGDRIEKLGISA
jgi:DNA-binding NtrC family response regulator